MKRKPPLVLIAGATASGKSALALALAERTGGVIVNADSAQIYRDLPILSAAPTLDDQARAEHRLYAVRDGATPCSAAEWADMARREITEVHARGRLPILAGGSGLYIRTLLEGIAPVPPVDPEMRDRIRSAGVRENRMRLQEADPEAAARLRPGDRTRIARALEVVLSTGRTLSAWQKHREGGIGGDVDLKPLILLPPRQWLYARCHARFEAMVEQGAIDEVKGLLARDLDPSLPVVRAIGVSEIAAYLGGEIGRDEMIARGGQVTRNYAKRQYTWFAHQPPAEWPRFTSALDDGTIAEALALLDPSA
jgi:tRNA dimethylallyltransferase